MCRSRTVNDDWFFATTITLFGLADLWGEGTQKPVYHDGRICVEWQDPWGHVEMFTCDPEVFAERNV